MFHVKQFMERLLLHVSRETFWFIYAGTAQTCCCNEPQLISTRSDCLNAMTAPGFDPS
jgi:hypothetical protein